MIVNKESFPHGVLEMINILSYNTVCMQVLYAIFDDKKSLKKR